MTYTKRQWFIYRLKQCINLIAKASSYMDDVDNYVLFSKYAKRIAKLHKKIDNCLYKLQNFLDEVKQT